MLQSSFRHPHGDSNPGLRNENPLSWASRRWGRILIDLIAALATGRFLGATTAKCQAPQKPPFPRTRQTASNANTASLM
jgi:hypothetical protein